jgi:hypothetical protein
MFAAVNNEFLLEVTVLHVTLQNVEHFILKLYCHHEMIKPHP